MSRLFKRHLVSLPVAVVLCLGLFFHVPSAWADSPDDIIIIANKGVLTTKTGLPMLRAIFLKKLSTWKNGMKVEPFVAPRGSAIRAVFAQKVLGMPADDELRYWEDLGVTRGLMPPEELPSSDYARIKKVFQTRGAISYVYRKNLVGNVVKILFVIPSP